MTTLLDFPALGDARGRLAFLEGGRHVPFEIRSVSWWSGLQARRPGARAVCQQDQVMFAIAGSMDVQVHGDDEPALVRLDRPDRGLPIAAATRWEVRDASEDAVGVIVRSGGPMDPAADGVAGKLLLPTVADATLLSLPRASGAPGETEVRAGRDVPFGLARLYYLYGIPAGSVRGSHAHRELQQLVVAVSGSFEIVLNDGVADRVVRLDRPEIGLHVPRGLWRDLRGFSSDAVCLVLASLCYAESDYIRDHDEFVAFRRAVTRAG